MNLRTFGFLAILAILIGIPAYSYYDAVRSGGIRQRADGVTEVDLKAMSSFPFDQDNGTLEQVPEQWRALNGKKVELVGEMWQPNAAGDAVDSFSLVYSIAKCCVTSAPQIQHFVQAKAADNRPIPLYSGPVKAIGTLRVNVIKDEASNKITAVYQLELEELRRA
jgi:hypothetical protein